MNTLKDMAILNIIKLGINPKVFFAVIFNLQSTLYKKLNSRRNIKKVSSARVLKKSACLAKKSKIYQNLGISNSNHN